MSIFYWELFEAYQQNARHCSMVPQSLPPRLGLIYAKNNYTPWSFTPGASKGAPWGVLWGLMVFEQYFCGSLRGGKPGQLQDKLVLSLFIRSGSRLMEASTYHGKRGWHRPVPSRNTKVNWSSSPVQNVLGHPLEYTRLWPLLQQSWVLSS